MREARWGRLGPLGPLVGLWRARLSRGRKSGESGVAAVEFAILLPVLLIILAGLVDFSLIFYNQAMLTNASREAARAGIVLREPKMTTDDIANVAIAYSNRHLISPGGAGKLGVDVNRESPIDFATRLTVSVNYDYSGILLDSFVGAISGPLRITATTVMLNE